MIMIMIMIVLRSTSYSSSHNDNSNSNREVHVAGALRPIPRGGRLHGLNMLPMLRDAAAGKDMTVAHPGRNMYVAHTHMCYYVYIYIYRERER